jgi:CheY-like chemotaxis protein
VARRSTILLVEDNSDDALLVLKAVQRTLTSVPLMRVNNGVEALQYLKGEGPFSDRTTYPFPDIVLLDLKMPRMNGFEVLESMRRDPNLKRLPVIVLTGSAENSDTLRAYEAGANSYVVKPSDFGVLVETIRSLGDFWLGGSMLPNMRSN